MVGIIWMRGGQIRRLLEVLHDRVQPTHLRLRVKRAGSMLFPDIFALDHHLRLSVQGKGMLQGAIFPQFGLDLPAMEQEH
jgi:hypothetical protein